ncbi:MAG: hypothetical protein GPOALKHO_000097 [Sodalis sp.]|nr:MAG: hypothetical protein GPOALKHO_000097 [Sodalis sp.]
MPTLPSHFLVRVNSEVRSFIGERHCTRNIRKNNRRVNGDLCEITDHAVVAPNCVQWQFTVALCGLISSEVAVCGGGTNQVLYTQIKETSAVALLPGQQPGAKYELIWQLLG